MVNLAYGEYVGKLESEMTDAEKAAIAKMKSDHRREIGVMIAARPRTEFPEKYIPFPSVPVVQQAYSYL